MNVLPSAPEYDAAQTQQPQPQQLYPTQELAQLSAEDFRLKKINDLLKELSDEAEHYRQVAKKYKRTHSIVHRSAVGLGSLSVGLSSGALATALTGFGILASPALAGVATLCRQCLTKTLKRRDFSYEHCCEKCGLLKPLDGVSFDDNEMYQYTDYKVTKQRRPKNRCYNFKYYLDKHVRILKGHNYTVSAKTVQSAKEAFNAMEAVMPKRISMPFVCFKILEHIVRQEERFLLGYFLMQVPEGSVQKNNEKWESILRQFDEGCA